MRNDEEREDFLPPYLWAAMERIGGPVRHLLTPWAKDLSFSEYLITSRTETLISGWSTPPLDEDLPLGGEGAAEIRATSQKQLESSYPARSLSEV